MPMALGTRDIIATDAGGASRAGVLVVPPDPELPVVVALLSAFRGVVEDRVVAHEELQPAPRRGVGVEDLVAVADERAEPGALGEVAGCVGARGAGVVLDDRREPAPGHPRDDFAALFRRVREPEVEVEVARRG